MTVSTSLAPRSERKAMSFASKGDPGLFGLRRRNSKEKAQYSCSSKATEEEGGNDHQVPVATEIEGDASKKSTVGKEPNSPRGELRHSSDTSLYSASQEKKSSSCLLSGRQWSGGRLLGNKKAEDFPCSGAQNEEFTTSQHQPYTPPAGAGLSIAQRSGKGGVKAVIAIIESKSRSLIVADEEEARNDVQPRHKTCHRAAEPNIDPPTAECYALSQWASDPYYRVVISSSGGIPAIIRAMKAHPLSADLQAVGCEALTNFTFNSVANQLQILSAGGIEILFAAMRNHPTNDILQGLACDALLGVTSILMQQSLNLMMEHITKVEDAAELLEQAREKLREAKFLSERCWENVGFLLKSVALYKSSSSLQLPPMTSTEQD
uniref:Uncharacterized protein n=1 Tax=Helicotheca tamesis TaxID=374047 RepID=A0A7S2HZX5_9STRA|mmetsp:Transcript_4165/g.5649  ORF Transcript_4165/g.5649 Transcript_4165/m.5649 type:complete len:378 (+) Transcript_4165:385-1518(+)|eukprot:CAMPEP_0185724498 /NCGR_PEP_ID=MMETSP1171-20130828/963_1 /TAXON_ID=374046 /ORGANISM="Helicotheca tamensis, Strain CCMP826" /LENGTH=377 /DNA_ID=CAMNT_0028392363 /DNA_START=282 /DNA_END=1415 /DNA_ORIENTATION=-